MKSFQEIVAKCVILLHISCESAAAVRSITSQVSANNYILREERTDSLASAQATLLVSSDIPITIQRYTGGATLPSRGGCEENPLGEEEGIILVTSNCDTSETILIPEISLGEVVQEWGGPRVESINIVLGVSPQEAASMDFLEPTSYKMERSYDGCTKIYCGEKPWGSRSEENSANSLQFVGLSFMALARGVCSKLFNDDGKQNYRALDTCTYNAEMFVNGCAYGPNINVTAPNVRIADATTNYNEAITIIDEKMSEFNETVDFTFPKCKLSNLGEASNAEVQIAHADSHDCNCCMCVGRPFVDASGSMLQAAPLSTASNPTCSWSRDTTVVNHAEKKLIEHSPNQNEFILGQEWIQSALGEHASIASFAAFTIALMTNGAPSDLVEDALKAGLDEIRHAEISFEIASKLTGTDSGPGPLPKSTHSFQNNLTELAMAVTREGCIDETLSALAAAAEAEAINVVLETRLGMNKYLNITDSTLIWIRDELRKIALDESNHSALAWRTLKWVCSVDAEACRVVNEVFLDERKLAMDFYRRFGSLDMESEALMNLAAGWRKIYTAHESFKLIGKNLAHEHIFCASSASGTTSLLITLVDNILRNLMCNR